MGESSFAIALNPALSLSVALGKQMEQIRQAQLNMVKQYNQAVSLAFRSPLLELAEKMRASQETFARNLLRSVNPFLITTESNIDVKKSETVKVKLRIADVNLLEGGLFAFKGEIIRTISTNTKQGRFFRMLLTYNDNYVSDQEAIKKLDIPDIDRGISYIRRDLIEDLSESGYEIELHRHTKKGYSLLGLKRLPN